MTSYTMKERQIPLNNAYDVIVVGGGPAGCTAAISASREGAKTLLIEASGALGGLGTIGLVPAWCPFSDKEKMIYRGLAEKVFEASKSGMRHVKPNSLDWVPIDPEHLKRVYDRMVRESGADVLFATSLYGAEAECGVVGAIIVGNKSGLSAYQAKCYIDCTGDGDLCVWAGAEYEKGGGAGHVMPSTHCFTLSNVDMYGYIYGVNLHGGNKQSPIYDIAQNPKYSLINDAHCCNTIVGPGTVGFNAGHLYEIDATDAISVSKAYMDGRELAAQFRDALAEYAPKAFGNAFLAVTAPLMGIRESRRIIGDYVLTLDDYLARRGFEDEICRNCYCVDIHNSLEDFQERIKKGIYGFDDLGMHYNPGESHGIPYRCLTPKGLKNVLVAGRSISCDQSVQGSVRVMPVCLCMGEAAGMAAAHAAEAQKADVHSVDVNKLRKRLCEEGAYIK